MVVIEVFLLGFSLLVIAALGGENSPWLSGFTTSFISILLEAIPFIILGSVVSGLIEVFVPQGLFNRLLPRNRTGAVLACSLLGMAFPICECGVIPVVRRLVRKGVPASCAITYMLAAPLINVVVISSTLLAFQGRWGVVGMRLGLGFLTAVTIGLWFAYVMEPRRAVLKEDLEEDAHEHEHEHEHASAAVCLECAPDQGAVKGLGARLAAALEVGAHDFFVMGRYFILGSLVAALLQASVPRDSLRQIGSGTASGPLTMMLLAVCLSLCSEADAFVASSFQAFSLPSVLAFLVLGPMFDIKLFLMYFEIFQKRTILVLAVALPVLVFVWTWGLLPAVGVSTAPMMDAATGATVNGWMAAPGP